MATERGKFYGDVIFQGNRFGFWGGVFSGEGGPAQKKRSKAGGAGGGPHSRQMILLSKLLRSSISPYPCSWGQKQEQGEFV